jgi:hypothetical protein
MVESERLEIIIYEPPLEPPGINTVLESKLVVWYCTLEDIVQYCSGLYWRVLHPTPPGVTPPGNHLLFF